MPATMNNTRANPGVRTQLLLSLFAVLAFVNNQVIMFSVGEHSHAKLTLGLATAAAGVWCAFEMLGKGHTRGQLLLFLLSTSAVVNSQVILYFPGQLRGLKAVLGLCTAAAGCLSAMAMLKEMRDEEGVKED